jgi:hypothetical protein
MKSTIIFSGFAPKQLILTARQGISTVGKMLPVLAACQNMLRGPGVDSATGAAAVYHLCRCFEVESQRRAANFLIQTALDLMNVNRSLSLRKGISKKR